MIYIQSSLMNVQRQINCRILKSCHEFRSPKPCKNVRLYSNQSNWRNTVSSKVRGSVLTTTAFGGFFWLWYLSKQGQDKMNGLNDEFHEKFIMPNTKKLVLYKRKGHWIPYDFVGSDKLLEDVKHFQVRPDDVFVVSFPKSGTTWVQEIVYLIKCTSDNKLDRWRCMDERFPYLEFAYPGISELKTTKGQRFIKTHLQYEALPEDLIDGKGKMIYVARNVKDVTVSMFHFYKLITNVHYTGSFSEFCEVFNSGQVAYGPYWKHVAEFWQKRKSPNMLFITYEGLQKDIKSEIKKIAAFIGINVTEKDIESIARKCRFTYMKHNSSTNYNRYKDYGLLSKDGDFLRKGKVGDWKQYYSDKEKRTTDKLTKDKFKPIGLHIPDSASCSVQM